MSGLFQQAFDTTLTSRHSETWPMPCRSSTHQTEQQLQTSRNQEAKEQEQRVQQHMNFQRTPVSDAGVTMLPPGPPFLTTNVGTNTCNSGVEKHEEPKAIAHMTYMKSTTGAGMLSSAAPNSGSRCGVDAGTPTRRQTEAVSLDCGISSNGNSSRSPKNGDVQSLRRQTDDQSLWGPGFRRSKASVAARSDTKNGIGRSGDLTPRLEAACVRAQRIMDRFAELQLLVNGHQHSPPHGCSVTAITVMSDAARSDSQSQLSERTSFSRTLKDPNAPNGLCETTVICGSGAHEAQPQPDAEPPISPHESSAADRPWRTGTGSAHASEDGGGGSSSSSRSGSSSQGVERQSAGLRARGPGSGDGVTISGLAQQLALERARADALEVQLQRAVERHAKDIEVLHSLRAHELLKHDRQMPPSPLQSAGQTSAASTACTVSPAFKTPGRKCDVTMRCHHADMRTLTSSAAGAAVVLGTPQDSLMDSGSCRAWLSGGGKPPFNMVAATAPPAAMAAAPPRLPLLTPQPQSSVLRGSIEMLPLWLEEHRQWERERELEAKLEHQRERERQLEAQVERQQLDYAAEVVLQERRHRQEVRRLRSEMASLEQQNRQFQALVRKLQERLGVRDQVISLLTMDCEGHPKKGS